MNANDDHTRQTLAGKAFAQGRFGLGASFRFGRPRGAFCHSGWCQQCKVALSDGRVGLACRLPAADLDALKRNAPWKSPISLLARFMRPWFHERVIFPGPLQQIFLRFVRHATRALPLGSISAPVATARTATCDTLVIGGGDAGVAAISALRELGVDALLVDERTVDSPPSEGRLSGTTAVGIYQEKEGEEFILCVDQAGSIRISFRRLVVATGTYDRPLSSPGSDLPGIIGLGAFRQLVAARSLPRNKSYGLFASKIGATEAARLAKSGGIHFQWAAGSPDLPVEVATKIHPSASIEKALGRSRLRAIQLSNGRCEACDVLVVGYPQPRYEFQLQAGQSVDWAGVGAGIEAVGPARFPMLTVGSATGLDGSETEATLTAIKDWIENRPPHQAGGGFERMPGCADLHDDLIVCPCEDVRAGDVRAAIRDGYDGIEHLKRRTGAATGPCQGKLCHGLLLHCLAAEGAPAQLPTMRPLVRPTRLASFAGGRGDA